MDLDLFVRFLLRLVLVPLGYAVALAVGTAVIVVGDWRVGDLFHNVPPDEAMLGAFVAVVSTLTFLALLLSAMWPVAAVGILFSEAFAVRSWLFHAANGAVCALVGQHLLAPADSPSGVAVSVPILAAGLAGGLAYWLVAGSSAGFFRPVLRSPAARSGRRMAPPQPEDPPSGPS